AASSPEQNPSATYERRERDPGPSQEWVIRIDDPDLVPPGRNFNRLKGVVGPKQSHELPIHFGLPARVMRLANDYKARSGGLDLRFDRMRGPLRGAHRRAGSVRHAHPRGKFRQQEDLFARVELAARKRGQGLLRAGEYRSLPRGDEWTRVAEVEPSRGILRRTETPHAEH